MSYGAQLASETAVISNLWPALPPRNTTRNRSTIIRFDGDGAAKLPPPSVIPPHNTTRNRSTIICFDGRWCSKVTPIIRHSVTQYDAKLPCHHPFWWAMVQQSYTRHPPFHRTIQREIAVPSFVLMGDGAAKLPPSSAIPPHSTT